MNKKILKLTAFLLLLTGLASSCNPECPPDCPDEYPQNISFTEYSLNETSCQWQNLPYDEKVIIINSSEELEKYISCTEGAYPAVGFSKHTLLLASGKTNGHISEVTAKNLKQLASNKYKLDVEVISCNLTHIESWSIAIVVEKPNNKSHVELDVARKEIEVELELGLYIVKNPPEGHYYNTWEFIDRENLMLAGGFSTWVKYYKYEVAKNTITLTDNYECNTYYFHIIHSTKFEVGESEHYVTIYEKR